MPVAQSRAYIMHVLAKDRTLSKTDIPTDKHLRMSPFSKQCESKLHKINDTVANQKQAMDGEVVYDIQIAQISCMIFPLFCARLMQESAIKRFVRIVHCVLNRNSFSWFLSAFLERSADCERLQDALPQRF